SFAKSRMWISATSTMPFSRPIRIIPSPSGPSKKPGFSVMIVKRTASALVVPAGKPLRRLHDQDTALDVHGDDHLGDRGHQDLAPRALDHVHVVAAGREHVGHASDFLAARRLRYEPHQLEPVMPAVRGGTSLRGTNMSAPWSASAASRSSIPSNRTSNRCVNGRHPVMRSARV